MTTFDEALQDTLGHEGGYSNHPNDRGGATNFGITEAVARANGYKGDMKEMPIEIAKEIYRKEYWNRLRLDEIGMTSKALAKELFDSCVNVGVHRAGTWLQESLNLLCRDIRKGNIAVDGIIGNGTLSRYRELSESDLQVCLQLVRLMQGAHYIQICRRDPTQRAFIRGWIKRV